MQCINFDQIKHGEQLAEAQGPKIINIQHLIPFHI